VSKKQDGGDGISCDVKEMMNSDGGAIIEVDGRPRFVIVHVKWRGPVKLEKDQLPTPRCLNSWHLLLVTKCNFASALVYMLNY